MISCSIFVWRSNTVLANPEDGIVTAGAASITHSGPVMTIMQSSDRAAIDWNSFNVDPLESIRFNQPSASSIILNRVTGPSPSSILGSLQANGTVLLVNRNGILFGKDSKIDVGSIVASTADIDNVSFMGSDRYLKLLKPGSETARIINQGQITAREAGLVGLVAPQLENSGIINAHLGRIQLGAGDTATLDLYGDDLMSIDVSASQMQRLIHTGTLQADGGTIQITAASGKNLINSFLGVSGYVSAKSVGVKNGRIMIYAKGSNAVLNNHASEKGIATGISKVMVDSIIDAAGLKTGENGGQVDILGDDIRLAAGTIIDTSGDVGGGLIRIGGDYLGAGNTPTSLYTHIDAEAFLLNNAITSGNGGKTIVWSDGDTDFYGNIFARGGLNSGNGGFAETSGHNHLVAKGYVNLTAPQGEKGTYLLDPTNIAIYGNVDPRFQSTDLAMNLLGSLRYWSDASDASTITLNFNNDGLSSALVTGTIGTNTITTTTNLNLTTPLAAGAKIRLGNTNGQTALANDTSNTNTYIIQSVSYTAGVGTTITLTTSLTANYNTGLANNSLYRGLVSQWNDKSNNAYNTTSSTASRMPLWISNAHNGLGGIRFDGADNMTSATGAYPTSADYTVGTFVNQTAANTGNVLSGVGSGHAFYFNNSQRICMYAAGCFATSGTNLPYGTAGLVSGTFVNSSRLGTVYQNGISVGSGTASATNTQNTFNIGSYGTGNYYTGYISEAYLYNVALNTNQRNLLDQYQSAKWNVAIDPFSGTALSEAVEAMDATNGYSVFSTRYLERLAQTANISLQASNNITLDLKTDTLNLATAGRSLTLTAGNQINTLSAGNITTNGGNITFNATGGISLAHALNLTSNGGHITMGNNLTLGANQNFTAGTGNLTFSGTVNGGNSLTASSNAFTLLNPWGGSTPLNAVSLTSVSGLTLPSISAASLLARTTGASSDIVIGSGAVLSASVSGNALTLASARNFINNAGASALSTPAGRWLIYSTRPADNQRNGIMPSATAIYNATYTGNPPAGIASGNRLLFSSLVSTAPTLTFTADSQSKVYGSANPSLTFSRTGSFVDADTASDAFSGSPAITTTIDTTTGVGTYTGDIDAAVGTLSSYLGYQFGFADGNFSVTQAPLSITASNRSKNYGDTAVFAGTEFTSTGLLNTDSISSVTLNSTGASATATVSGSPYAITPSSAVGTGLANYSISYTNGLLSITTIPLSVVANNQTKTYGTTFTFAGTEFTSSGLINSDNISSVSLVSAGATAGASVAGSPYAITPSAAVGTGLGNYSISYGNGTLTIDPAAEEIVSEQTITEPIYQMIVKLNDPIGDQKEPVLSESLISYDTQLTDFLACTENGKKETLHTNCW